MGSDLQHRGAFLLRQAGDLRYHTDALASELSSRRCCDDERYILLNSLLQVDGLMCIQVESLWCGMMSFVTCWAKLVNIQAWHASGSAILASVRLFVVMSQSANECLIFSVNPLTAAGDQLWQCACRRFPLAAMRRLSLICCETACGQCQ